MSRSSINREKRAVMAALMERLAAFAVPRNAIAAAMGVSLTTVRAWAAGTSMGTNQQREMLEGFLELKVHPLEAVQWECARREARLHRNAEQLEAEIAQGKVAIGDRSYFERRIRDFRAAADECSQFAGGKGVAIGG